MRYSKTAHLPLPLPSTFSPNCIVYCAVPPPSHHQSLHPPTPLWGIFWMVLITPFFPPPSPFFFFSSENNLPEKPKCACTNGSILFFPFFLFFSSLFSFFPHPLHAMYAII